MTEKTMHGMAVRASYRPPIKGEAVVAMRVRRRAPKGSSMEYGDTWIDLELVLPPWIARDLVQAIRGGLAKVKEDKLAEVRSAESWINELERAARA